MGNKSPNATIAAEFFDSGEEKTTERADCHQQTTGSLEASVVSWPLRNSIYYCMQDMKINVPVFKQHEMCSRIKDGGMEGRKGGVIKCTRNVHIHRMYLWHYTPSHSFFFKAHIWLALQIPFSILRCYAISEQNPTCPIHAFQNTDFCINIENAVHAHMDHDIITF